VATLDCVDFVLSITKKLKVPITKITTCQKLLFDLLLQVIVHMSTAMETTTTTTKKQQQVETTTTTEKQHSAFSILLS